MAGKRKLAEPGQDVEVRTLQRAGTPRCPIEALSFMPTMLGWPASRATSAGSSVTPQKPGAL